MPSAGLPLKTPWGALELRPTRTPGERGAVSVFLAAPLIEPSIRQALKCHPQVLGSLLPAGQAWRLSRDEAVAELIQGIKRGSLVLARVSDGAGSDDAKEPAWLAYEAFCAQVGPEFSVAMRTYRLVSHVRAPDVKREGDFDVVPVGEGRALVLNMAKSRGGGQLQAHAEVLGKNLVDLRAPASQQGFVLLRKPLAQAARHVPAEDIITPAKLKELKNTAWIEIEVVYENGTPWAYEYELVLPDGQPRKGTAGQIGIVKVSNIPAGSCDFAFVRPDAALWSQ